MKLKQKNTETKQKGDRGFWWNNDLKFGTIFGYLENKSAFSEEVTEESNRKAEHENNTKNHINPHNSILE